jgi:hypothetical protein
VKLGALLEELQQLGGEVGLDAEVFVEYKTCGSKFCRPNTRVVGTRLMRVWDFPSDGYMRTVELKLGSPSQFDLAKKQHVCGLHGFNPMLGDTCGKCESERK